MTTTDTTTFTTTIGTWRDTFELRPFETSAAARAAAAELNKTASPCPAAGRRAFVRPGLDRADHRDPRHVQVWICRESLRR